VVFLYSCFVSSEWVRNIDGDGKNEDKGIGKDIIFARR
jgi:hypothetical protein